MDMQFFTSVEVQRRDRILTEILGEVEIKKKTVSSWKRNNHNSFVT
jgi:hypothetical protein